MSGRWLLACAVCAGGASALSVIPAGAGKGSSSTFPRENAASSPQPQGGPKGSGAVAAAERRRLAVIIVGLEEHLLLAPKLKQVAQPALDEGYAVDFYIRLIETNNNVRFADCFKTKTVEPHFKSFVKTPRYVEEVRKTITKQGATVQYIEVSKAKEHIDLPKARDDHRVWQYNPYTSEVGRNLLRRYMSLENLTSMALEKHRYDFVLVTRDDDHYLGKLNLTRFAEYNNFTNRVFSKGCLVWYGINDKTMLFGGEAANRTLSRLYSDFWMPDERLNHTYNAEKFTKEFINVTGSISTPVSFADIPTADSAWVVNRAGKTVLCQRSHYLCDRHPNENRTNKSYWQKLDQPDWCADLWTNPGGGQPDPHLEPKANLGLGFQPTSTPKPIKKR